MRGVFGPVAFATVVTGLTVLMMSSPVVAADLTIPIDTMIVSGVPAGAEEELTVVASGDLAGQTCGVRAVRDDSADVNPGNNLVLDSGASSSTLEDVERAPGAVTDGTPIALSETITVTLLMGPSESFEGSIDIELDCGSGDGPATQVDAEAEGVTTGDEPAELPSTGRETTITLLAAVVFVAAGGSLWLASRHPRTT